MRMHLLIFWYRKMPTIHTWCCSWKALCVCRMASRLSRPKSAPFPTSRILCWPIRMLSLSSKLPKGWPKTPSGMQWRGFAVLCSSLKLPVRRVLLAPRVTREAEARRLLNEPMPGKKMCWMKSADLQNAMVYVNIVIYNVFTWSITSKT